MRKINFKAELWIYPGPTPWHFISLPKKESEEIKAASGPRRGWGAVKVKARIGETNWVTSIFPDKKTNTYILPIKLEVRKKENLKAGQKVELTLE